VEADLGDGVFILDAGPVDVGVESTVIDLTERQVLLLRPGGIPVEKLEAFFGERIGSPGENAKRRSPGTRYRHYAPSLPVSVWRPGEGAEVKSEEEDDDGGFPPVDPSVTGYIGMTPPPAECALSLLFDSPESYARGIFAGFRRMEAERLLKAIVVEWPSAEGIGLALRDRVRRASSRQ
jgi:L-threonylcarbamoyladenylate synthase